MRIKPLEPDTLSPELRYVHDEITGLVGNSQGQVKMTDKQGALLGPFIPMLHFPQFGIASLSFLRTLDTQATLNKKVREIAILTVGGYYGAKFVLYAHEIMADAFGIAPGIIATLASGGRPLGLNDQENVVYDISFALVHGRIVPDPTYNHAVALMGMEGVAELYFLVSAYSMVAMILNGFDIPTP